MARLSQSRRAGRLGAPVRGRPDPGLVGEGHPSPALPRWQPRGQPCPVADRDHPDEQPPCHLRLRGAAHRRRPVEDGDHPVPEALRRPRGIPLPAHRRLTPQDPGNGVVVPDHVMGVEAGLDPPQPTVGVLGPQCGPRPRSEPGRPSRRRRSIRLSGNRRFSPGERRWISATPGSVVGCSVGNPQNGRRYGGFASRPPQATCNVQAIRSPSRPCEPGELNRGPHRDHLPSRPASG